MKDTDNISTLLSLEEHQFPVTICFGSKGSLQQTMFCKPCKSTDFIRIDDYIAVLNALFQESDNGSHELDNLGGLEWGNLKRYTLLSCTHKELRNPYSLSAFLNTISYTAGDMEFGLDDSLKSIPHGNINMTIASSLNNQLLPDDEILKFANVYKSTLDTYKCFTKFAIAKAIILHTFRHDMIIQKCLNCGNYFIAAHGNMKYCDATYSNSKGCKYEHAEKTRTKALTQKRYVAYKRVYDRLYRRKKTAEASEIFNALEIERRVAELEDFATEYARIVEVGTRQEILDFLNQWDEKTKRKGK